MTVPNDDEKEVEKEEEDSNEEAEEDIEKEGEEEEEDKDTEAKSSNDASGFADFPKIDDVPKELQSHYKKMIDAVKKERGKLKEEVKSLENELGTKYSQFVIKGKALDALSVNPQFQQFYADLEANRPYGYSSVFNKGGKVKEVEADDTEDTGKELTEGRVEKLVERAISKHIRPLLESRAKDSYALAEKNLPNFARYKPAITEILQSNPNMSLTDAYKLASYDDRVSETDKALDKKDSDDVDRLRKKPRSEGKTTGRSDTLAAPAAKTIREAIQFGLSKQK